MVCCFGMVTRGYLGVSAQRKANLSRVFPDDKDRAQLQNTYPTVSQPVCPPIKRKNAPYGVYEAFSDGVLGSIRLPAF